MSDDVEREFSGGANPAAAILALGDGKPLDPRAVAFLEKQSRLTDLQIEEIEREDQLRLWALRVRHTSGVMKLAFEFAAAFILLVGAAILMGAIWTASHDKSLVIEAFDVPPDLVERGLSGQVIAARIEDRLSWMQSHTVTSRVAGTYRHDWGNDISVQIPQTGMSIGEVYRYLVAWLGNQTHITGEIWRTPNGFALATRAGSYPAPVLTAPEADLDGLILKAAEEVYRQTQPYRYSAYLDREGRIAEELKASRELAIDGPSEEKAWGFTRWGVVLQSFGDLKGAVEKQHMATVLGPNLPHAWYDLASAEATIGHDDAAFQHNMKALQILNGPAAGQLAAYAVAVDIPILTMLTDEATGDYRGAIAQVPHIEAIAPYGASHQSAAIMLSADLASDHDVSASLKADGESPGAERAGLLLGSNGSFELQPLPGFLRAAMLDDWKAARNDLMADDKSDAAKNVSVAPMLPVLTWSWLAYANAKLGDFPAAHALIDRTPLDCDQCLRLRGDIDRLQSNWGGADYWFERAIHDAPSLPFADTDWGRMLLARGILDAAIEKFALASRKGAHFADPLEFWGEALIAKSRSDLALLKFEEANKYAPNWGRLHLKWGEALFFAGDAGGARAQFAIASGLDLTPSEKSELAHVRAAHG